MANSEILLKAYAAEIKPLLALAQQAYGSRSTESPAHEASKKYTTLLKDFHDYGGSLPEMAELLGVQYAGLMRRVSTANLVPNDGKRSRPKLSVAVYEAAVDRILAAKAQDTKTYHDQIKTEYDAGLSLSKIAKLMELSSANPLYYGLQRARIRNEQTQTT